MRDSFLSNLCEAGIDLGSHFNVSFFRLRLRLLLWLFFFLVLVIARVVLVFVVR